MKKSASYYGSSLSNKVCPILPKQEIYLRGVKSINLSDNVDKNQSFSKNIKSITAQFLIKSKIFI